jgi:hypothetical protein
MTMLTDQVLKLLEVWPEPIVRWKLRNQEGEDGSSRAEYKQAKKEIESSQIIRGLLRDREYDGRISYHPYNKWFGAHWILSILADLRYPIGDVSLKPLLEQCYVWLLSKEHEVQIKTINGRVRRCASQEGNCVYYSLALGIADDRTEQLVTRLIKWQWEDGGWNCDKRPEAFKSSFNETLIPLRGLALYTKLAGDPKSRLAVERAAEVFLKRSMYKRLSDGSIIDPNFIELHYPCYWHYDILFGLKIMDEAGFIHDVRCKDALDLLETKQLKDGGFPAEAKYYRVDDKKLTGHSRVDWGGTSKVHMNPYVSLDAISVLVKTGRLTL